MITKQCEKIFSLIFAGKDELPIQLYDYTGTLNNLTLGSPSYIHFNGPGSLDKISSGTSDGVSFWSGATEPTRNDIKGDGTCITGLQGTVATEITSNENGTTAQKVYTLTNTNSHDVTIDTVCCVVGFTYAYSKVIAVLIDRTKLETPITIAAGGVGQVTYTLGLNFPS